MSIARLYVNGESWEIMGNATDNFLTYSNTLESSRGGRVYATSETKVRTVSIDSVKIDISEFKDIVEFFESCKASTTSFNVTVSIDEDCEDGATEYHYTGCLIQGEPEFSIFEKTISGFEFGYSNRIIKD